MLVAAQALGLHGVLFAEHGKQIILLIAPTMPSSNGDEIFVI